MPQKFIPPISAQQMPDVSIELPRVIALGTRTGDRNAWKAIRKAMFQIERKVGPGRGALKLGAVIKWAMQWIVIPGVPEDMQWIMKTVLRSFVEGVFGLVRHKINKIWQESWDRFQGWLDTQKEKKAARRSARNIKREGSPSTA